MANLLLNYLKKKKNLNSLKRTGITKRKKQKF